MKHPISLCSSALGLSLALWCCVLSLPIIVSVLQLAREAPGLHRTSSFIAFDIYSVRLGLASSMSPLFQVPAVCELSSYLFFFGTRCVSCAGLLRLKESPGNRLRARLELLGRMWASWQWVTIVLVGSCNILTQNNVGHKSPASAVYQGMPNGPSLGFWDLQPWFFLRVNGGLPPSFASGSKSMARFPVRCG